MVSLRRNFTMNTGAQHMDDNTTNASTDVLISGSTTRVGINDRQELLDPVLASNDDGEFNRLNTIPVFSLHMLISVVISFVGIVLVAAWPVEKRCEAYFIMLYLRALFWMITFFVDHIVKKYHDDLRLNGYHEFHRSTAMQKGIALQLVSFWNTVLLAVQAFIHHFYGDKFWMHCLEGFFAPVTYVAAFSVAETIILAVTHGNYISKVVKFNGSAQPPDALRGTNSTSGFLGLMQPGGSTEELLEKQADLIAYLKDHNQKLNQKLHQMQLQASTGNMSH